MESILWTEAAEPCNTSLADVIYNIRREDPENLLMDSVTSADILADADDVLMFDALVVPYQQLLRRMNIMRRLMNRAGTKLKVEEDTDEMKGMVISDPFKKNGAAQVAVTFNLEDGQTISIFFHNPDATPSKIAPSDDLISWKWLLNKKDVTIVVAPEHGKDLDVHEVSRRIMKLADKNSAAFARANAKKAERLQKIEEQESEIASLEAELAKAKAEFEKMQADADKQAKRLAEVSEKYAVAEKRVTDLTKERDELKAKKEAEAAAKKAAEEKAAAEQASKKGEEGSTQSEGFPELKDNEDFANFEEPYRDETNPEAPANVHMLNYLKATGQTHFSVRIGETDVGVADGKARYARLSMYNEWKLEDGKWSVKQGENGYWDETAARKAYWAFDHFAQGVRNGTLKIIGGTANASEKPLPKAERFQSLDNMTEGQLLDLAKHLRDGDDSVAKISEGIGNGDRATIDAIVSTMKKYGYDKFCWGKALWSGKLAGGAYRLNGEQWEKIRWANRTEVAFDKDDFAEVIYMLGEAYSLGMLRKGLGGLDDPYLAPKQEPEQTKITSVEEFCKRYDAMSAGNPSQDDLNALMEYLEAEWPRFHGEISVKTRSPRGSAKRHDVVIQLINGIWYRHLADKEWEWISSSKDGLTKAQILYYFRTMVKDGTLERYDGPEKAPQNPKIAPVFADDWAKCEEELDKIIAGTHPEIDDGPLLANWFPRVFLFCENNADRTAKVKEAESAWERYTIAAAKAALNLK